MIVNPKRLKELREGKGHTTWSLAGASGVSQSRVWELEQGEAEIRPTTAGRLAKALGVEIKDITVQATPAKAASS